LFYIEQMICLDLWLIISSNNGYGVIPKEINLLIHNNFMETTCYVHFTLYSDVLLNNVCISIELSLAQRGDTMTNHILSF
jgi:hypothetical protein